MQNPLLSRCFSTVHCISTHRAPETGVSHLIPCSLAELSTMSSIVRINCLEGAVSQRSCFPRQGVSPAIWGLFSPLSTHNAFLDRSAESDVINLPGLPRFIFQASSPTPQRLYPLDCKMFHSYGLPGRWCP